MSCCMSAVQVSVAFCKELSTLLSAMLAYLILLSQGWNVLPIVPDGCSKAVYEDHRSPTASHLHFTVPMANLNDWTVMTDYFSLDHSMVNGHR